MTPPAAGGTFAPPGSLYRVITPTSIIHHNAREMP